MNDQASVGGTAEVGGHASTVQADQARQTEQPDEVAAYAARRIEEAKAAGVVLSAADKAKIIEHLRAGHDLNQRAVRVSGRGADPLRKGNAFPMGVGYTVVGRRADRRIDASVRHAAAAVDLWSQAEAATKAAEALLAGKGTEAARQRAAARQAQAQRLLVTKLLDWTKGSEASKLGQFTITRVNKDGDGYPASYNIAGEGIIKGVHDKVDVVREFFRGSRVEFRALVDEIRAERQRAEQAGQGLTARQLPTLTREAAAALMASSKPIQPAAFAVLSWPDQSQLLHALNNRACAIEGRTYAEAARRRAPLEALHRQLQEIHDQQVREWVAEAATQVQAAAVPAGVDQDAPAVAALCHAIEQGYANDQAPVDAAMVPHLVGLGDRTQVIRALIGACRAEPGDAAAGTPVDERQLARIEALCTKIEDGYARGLSAMDGAMVDLLTDLSYHARNILALTPEQAGVRPVWQLTLAEFQAAVHAGRDFPQLGTNPTPLATLRGAGDVERLDRQAMGHHDAQVTMAAARGQAVPAHVLQDYPSLIPVVERMAAMKAEALAGSQRDRGGHARGAHGDEGETVMAEADDEPMQHERPRGG